MIKSVRLDNVVYENIPTLFEAGTPNVAGAYGLSLAVDYLKEIGMESIYRHERNLTNYIYRQAKSTDNITVYSGKSEDYSGIFSFNVSGLHSHDVAYMLDKKGIAVRSGYHCAQPLLEDKFKANGSVRASIYLYNTVEEVDSFFEELKAITAKYGRR